MIDNYLVSARKQFEYYKKLGDRTFDQVGDDQLFWEPSPDINSIATIVKHLHGNMLSRWMDFLNTDGEKPWRDRDGEFELDFFDRKTMLKKWEEGWKTLFAALDSVNAENAETVVYIRNMGHTVVEAINRQMAHYAYHVGQIVYLGKLAAGPDWQSLSIAKGNSQAYNADKMEKGKRRAHFTDEE